MEIILIIIGIIWYLIGVASFIYWWTKDHDLTLVDLVLAAFAGFGGIFSYFMGWFIHGNNINSATILKKRTK